MADRAIALDRDNRRLVRKNYYLRRENFDTDLDYNNYLEEVEDLVEDLVNESTRPAARQKLEQLRIQWAAQTAENLTVHDLEVRRREDVIEQERLAAQRAAQERLEAEQRKAVAAEQTRLALQQEVQSGTTSLKEARADMGFQTAAALAKLEEAAAAVAQQQQQQPGAQPDGYAGYVPAGGAAAGPPVPELAQPIDKAAAAAKQAAAPAFMLPSIKAQAEAYEADTALLQQVRAAGGYDRELWRRRYRQEALCA